MLVDGWMRCMGSWITLCEQKTRDVASFALKEECKWRRETVNEAFLGVRSGGGIDWDRATAAIAARVLAGFFLAVVDGVCYVGSSGVGWGCRGGNSGKNVPEGFCEFVTPVPCSTRHSFGASIRWRKASSREMVPDCCGVPKRRSLTVHDMYLGFPLLVHVNLGN